MADRQGKVKRQPAQASHLAVGWLPLPGPVQHPARRGVALFGAEFRAEDHDPSLDVQACVCGAEVSREYREAHNPPY